MDSDRQSTPSSTPEEEFLYIDGVSEDNYAHLSDDSSLKMDDAFSANRKETREEVFNSRSPSATVVEASDSEHHSDLVTPAASSSSVRLHSRDRFDIKASPGNTFFDQARRGSLHRQRTDSQMLARSKLCQTEWNWEEDLKLLALHSESSLFSDLLSEINEAKMKASLAEESGRASDKSSLRAKQFGIGSEAGDDDFPVFGWEKETHMESSDEGWLTPFIKTLPSVGPPQILQYNKESMLPSAVCPPSPKERTATSYGTLDEELQNYIFQLDRAARRAFVTQDSTTICPFCGKEASTNPYCCHAYQRHVEILRKSELHGYLTKKSGLDLKSQLLYGFKKAGESFAEDGSHLRLAKKRKQFAEKQMGQSKSSKEKQMGQSKSSKEKQMGQSKSSKEKEIGETRSSKEKQTDLRRKDQGVVRASEDHGSSRLARDVSSTLMARDGMPRLTSNRSITGPSTSLYQQGGRQTKTISYQLSSKKCLEDGWTLSISQSLARLELTDDYNDLIQISRMNGSNSLFVRTYEDGNIFAIIFPDGSGTIFHPDGKVAISAVQVDEGLYTYIVQDDSDESNILAVFQPDGHACIYFPNGRPRISLSPTGGLEIGRHGERKRKWLWCDMYDQQQRAPLQPITIGVTPECGIRIMSQGNITVAYNNNCRNIRLHVGIRLTLGNLQLRQATPKDLYDQDEQFRKEKKLRVATLINQILTVLEFPKSLKLNKSTRQLRLLKSNHHEKYETSRVTTLTS